VPTYVSRAVDIERTKSSIQRIRRGTSSSIDLSTISRRGTEVDISSMGFSRAISIHGTNDDLSLTALDNSQDSFIPRRCTIDGKVCF
jgi:hypothetical protein